MSGNTTKKIIVTKIIHLQYSPRLGVAADANFLSPNRTGKFLLSAFPDAMALTFLCFS